MSVVDLTNHGDVAVLIMRFQKANSMSSQMLTSLREALREVREREAESLVITAEGRSFSAGLALPDLIGLPRYELGEFMRAFEETMSDVLTLPMPTVAAINGHAIAGGCVLGLMCDERIMVAGTAKIGLTEARLGISLPAIVTEPLRYRLSARAASQVALGGGLFDAAEAAQLGLVDDVLESVGDSSGGPDESAPEQLVEYAVGRARSMVRPGAAYAQIKADLLRPVVSQIQLNERVQLEAWLDTWFAPEAQAVLAETVAGLSR